MKKSVGLFRVMTFEELDKTAEVMLKYSPIEAYEIMDETLAKTILGNTFRRKGLNNLTKVWGNGKKTLNDFQIKVLDQYSKSSHEEKTVFQILMMYYSFPFFADTIGIVGKYLRMNDSFQSKTIMEEIRNTYGMTETVNKGVLTVLGTLVNWGFLSTEKKGYYELIEKKIIIDDRFTKNVLIHAVLNNSESEYVSLEAINNKAEFFMFDYSVIGSDIIFHDLEVLRERMNTFVKLK